MSREDWERRQRMLAREKGNTVPGAVRGTTGNLGFGKVIKIRRSTDAQQEQPLTEEAGEQDFDNGKSIHTALKKRKKQKNIVFWAFVTLALVAVLALTGVLSSSLVLLSDAVDSISLLFTRAGDGFPVNTGIATPLKIAELGGGFVEVSAQDVVVYTAYGSKVRSFQPSYANPQISVGKNRFVLYNREGNELRVENRTRNLYTKTFSESIMLCSMSENGMLAVVTESERYVAELEVFDRSFQSKFRWSMTQEQGVPIAVSFAPDNHRLAVATLGTSEGQLVSKIYLLDVNTVKEGPISEMDIPTYEASAGNAALKLEWMGSDQLLGVFDCYVALIKASTMTEKAHYDFSGTTLQSAAVGTEGVALLMKYHGSNELITLGTDLELKAEIPAGQATGVSVINKNIYLLCGDRVQCYGFDGVLKKETLLDASPLAVLDAKQTLVFAGTTVQVLEE